MSDEELTKELDSMLFRANKYEYIASCEVHDLLTALKAMRAALVTQNERMRAVVEAALAFDDQWPREGDFTMDTSKAGDSLLRAIDAYRAWGAK